MSIANGRSKGDFLGNYTHFNNNKGQSTVDFSLNSDNLSNMIEDFKVLPQGIFSVHSKVILTIKNLKNVEHEEDTYNWIPLPHIINGH